MKTRRRLISIILSLLICFGGAFYSSAAEREIAELCAPTGLVPIGGGQSYEGNISNSISSLPSSYSSADLGYTLPVRMQHANTCWAFGTLSSFETLLLKDGENTEHFAPQHANYWATTRSDGTGWQRSSTEGGYSYIPLGYMTSWAGPINEADFPEEGTTQEQYDNFTTTPEYGVTEVVYFNREDDHNAIKELIYTYGSVVGNFNANREYLSQGCNFYCSDDTIATRNLQGHCISVVGWDDDYSKENFTGSKSGTPKQDGAWLIKNSWGSTYNSLGGYFWISYEDVWLFDDIFGPSYALTKYEKLNDGLKLYQNEIDGATYEFEYLKKMSKSITYMNVFDFEEDHRNLDMVVFETTSIGSEYQIYYIPLDGDTPTSETSLWKKLYSGTVTYTGYICADLKDTELPAGKGAIGVKITTNDDSVSASIGVCEWLQINTTTGQEMIFLPQSDFGMSYYMRMDKKTQVVSDVMSLYESALSDTIGGTFVIKAITRNDELITDNTEPSIPSETTTPEEITIPIETTAPPETSAPIESTPQDNSSATESTDSTSEPDRTQGTDNTFPIDEPFVYLLGDANLDNTVNIKDATIIQKYAAELVELSPRELLAADVSGNYIVNVIDSTNIQKYGAGISVSFNIGQIHIYYE